MTLEAKLHPDRGGGTYIRPLPPPAVWSLIELKILRKRACQTSPDAANGAKSQGSGFVTWDLRGQVKEPNVGSQFLVDKFGKYGS